MKKRVTALSLAVLMMFACLNSSAYAVGTIQTETNENQTVVTDGQEGANDEKTEIDEADKDAPQEESTMTEESQPSENQEKTQEESNDVTTDTKDSTQQMDEISNLFAAKQSLPASPLQTEIEAAPSGKATTISVSSNTVLETSLTIPAQKNIVLNLNSYKIESRDAAPLIIVEENAILTIQGTGTMVNSYENGVVIENNGTLVLAGGTLSASGKDGMVVSKTVNDGKEEGSYSLSSGSIEAEKAGSPLNTLKVLVLQAPTNLQASNDTHQSIRLTWTGAEGAKTYEVYQSTNKTSGFKKIGITSNNYYVSNQLTSGTTYYYKVKSISDNTVSAFSSTVTCVPKPSAPEQVKAVSTNYDSNRITWNPVSGATTYRVYRSTNENSGFKRIATVKSGTRYVDSGAENGVTYYYRVRACAGKVIGLANKSVSVKTVIKRPTQVKAESASYNAIRLNWKKVTGASRYAIYQSTNQSSGFKKIATVSSKTLQYRATGLKAGTNYYYRIYAIRRGVQGKASSVAYAAPIPQRVTSLSVTSGGNKKATINWSRAKGASRYEIYRSTNKNSGYRRVARVSTLSYTDSNLDNGTTYYYKIKSVAGSVKSKYGRAIAFTNAKRIKLNKTSISLNAGNTQKLRATFFPSNTTTKAVSWSSSNTSVATVTRYGTVKAKAAGTAVITATTVNGRKATCTVTVSNGIVIVLDPGHGGYDSGAVYNGVKEKDLNLKVSKYTRDELKKYAGVEVYMTRSTDVFIPLQERSEIAKNKGATCLISQHFNASVAHTATGAGVFVTVNNTYSAQSRALAQKILSQLKRDIGIGEWGVFTRASTSYPGQDYYAVIRGSVEKGFPGIIIENAFMDSSDFSKYLNTDAKLKKIGVSNAKAIADYYGLVRK